MALDKINEIHIDVLREIANIGSGNAASSLSRMIGHKVNINIPEISIKGFNEATEILGGPETIMVGTLLFLTEGINGMMMFLLPIDVVCDLVNMLMFTDIKSHEEIDEMGYSVIQECSNIMSASFVTAIAEMTDMVIDISPPEATLDMLGSIMSVPSISFADIGDSILLMTNELEIDGKKTSANVLLLPDMPSLGKLMSSLGIDF
ncbi:MAG: chemotaxis protein CheC [Oscillospiraceae bacterium]|jgi:chemotaxis protein CheC|nr:chemotaxis protein CheC [Oscillospiraceae bacterium]